MLIIYKRIEKIKPTRCDMNLEVVNQEKINLGIALQSTNYLCISTVFVALQAQASR